MAERSEDLTYAPVVSIFEYMKLVVSLKLLPTKDQFDTLKATLERCNSACNWIAGRANEAKVKGQFKIHHLVYKDVRKEFSLSAQVTVRSIAKVADSLKAGKGARREFRKHAGQPFDDRIFRFCKDDVISIWTLNGRQKIPFCCGEKQRDLLTYRKGEVDLLFVRGIFYISAVCDVPESEVIKTDDILGVDLGIVNIAVDSTGATFSGGMIDDNRRKFSHRRRNLQKKGTRAAKRKLKQISGRQSRFVKDVNHRVSKEIVEKAKRSRSAIALEQLKGIRSRIKARRAQRSRLHSWSFHQLQQFVLYKAKLAGIPVVLVNPRNTSRACPKCGHTEKGNRKTRDQFLCKSCGFAGPADFIAALNIKVRALVNEPTVATI